MTTMKGGKRPSEAREPRAGIARTRPSREVLFVQGGGEGAHDEWDSKLVASLEQALPPEYTIRYPRMPREADPEALAWKRAIARELAKLRDGAVVVGHSIGAAILLDHLASGQLTRRLAGVFLIASPYIGEGGWPSAELRPTKELAREIPGGTPLYLYQGEKDETVPFSHIGLLARALPQATVRRLEGRDHQLDNDLSEVARDIERLAVLVGEGRGTKDLS
jgi:predicted alpha/beta hydrolase family esterase